MHKLLAILAASLIWGAAANAQVVVDPARFPKPYISVPLDDPEYTYRLTAVPLNEMAEAITWEEVTADDIVSVVDVFLIPLNRSDLPTLQALPNGSVKLRWGCFACGKYHSETSVTVALRDTELKIIGYDYSYTDRHIATTFSCSINLLNGRYIAQAGTIDRQEGRTDRREIPLTTLHYNEPQPACDALHKYDYDWITANIVDQ